MIKRSWKLKKIYIQSVEEKTMKFDAMKFESD